MTRKTARTGVVAVILAGTAIMGSGLPAQAKTNTEPVGVLLLRGSTPTPSTLRQSARS
jgi:hypothetical protein